MSAGDILASSSGVILPGMSFTSGLFKVEGEKSEAKPLKNIEDFTAPDGGSLPPGMVFPSVEEFTGSINKVKEASESLTKGGEHLPVARIAMAPEVSSPDTKVAEAKSTESSVPLTESSTNEADQRLEEEKQLTSKPEEVGQAELDDIYNTFGNTAGEDLEPHDEDHLSESHPAPSDSLIVLEEVSFLSRRVETTDQRVAAMAQQLQIANSSIDKLLKENSVMTTAITDLQAEIRRLGGVDRSIRDRNERDRLANEQTIAMEQSSASGVPLEQIRQDLLRGTLSGAGFSLSTAEVTTPQKKFLFRDE